MKNEMILKTEEYNQLKNYCNKNYILENVLPKLVSIKNMEVMDHNDIPYKVHMDMLVTLYVSITHEFTDESPLSGGTFSIKILGHNLKDMGITFDDLYKKAINNLQNNYIIEPMVDVLQNLFEQSEIGYDSSTKELPDAPEMYVISTKHRTNGAAAILSDQVLQELYERFKGSYVVLPSSIHECIAVKLHDINDHAAIQDLIAIVKDVNDYVVADDDILSYSVYIYDNEILTQQSSQITLQGA